MVGVVEKDEPHLLALLAGVMAQLGAARLCKALHPGGDGSADGERIVTTRDATAEFPVLVGEGIAERRLRNELEEFAISGRASLGRRHAQDVSSPAENVELRVDS
jgi:hypothetical protein